MYTVHWHSLTQRGTFNRFSMLDFYHKILFYLKKLGEFCRLWEMTADTERIPSSKNTTCLICDASVGVSTRNSCPIFHQHVTTSDKPIYKIIDLVLDLEVTEDLVHSVVVCKKCFKLLNEVDELQERITEIQSEVKNNYKRTLRYFIWYADNSFVT